MVRTRFAPSPTGYLHIGGVRTALFNWLYARQNGGQFILRIDDTDHERNVEEALGPILHGFEWLGIDWDEGPGRRGAFGPYFQSQRADLYKQAAEKLLADGKAYRDFAKPEELQAERKEAQKAGGSFTYSRRFMAETDEQAEKFAAEGRQGVVRLLMPREGKCVIQDHIRGAVEFDWAREQDHVIQRADGSCLYHLASVVDDHEMRISHVIRAEEHLSNTPRQVFIAQSLGYELPEYAHLPFVAEPGSKNKLSKRKLMKYLKQPDFKKLYDHGRAISDRLGRTVSDETFNPVIVDFYEQVGYLPDAIINYLLLLGWSLDDKTEDFTRDEMIEHFSFARVNKAPASFDPPKLVAFQDRYMQRVPIDEKVSLVSPFLVEAGYVTGEPEVSASGPEDSGGSRSPLASCAEKVAAIVAGAGDRLKVAGDILDYDDFFVADDQLSYDEKAVNKRIKKGDAVELLGRFRETLAAAEDFTPAALESLLKRFVEEQEIKIGQIIHAVRVGVTGKAVGFGLFETLSIIGKESCLARIDRAMAL
jgi:glutamyl-tRNA synthetase